MGARLQTDVSSGKAGEEGDLQSNVGDDPLPRATHPNKPPSFGGAEKFEQVDLPAVAGGRKVTGSQHAGAPDGGGLGPSFAFAKESRGINEVAGGLSAKGNSPVRSAGRKTTEADRRPLSTAGS